MQTLDKPKIVLPESLHYYDILGNPVHEVPRATPKRIGQCPECGWMIDTTAKGKTTCKGCKSKVDVSGFVVVTMKPTTDAEAKKYGLFLSVSRIATYGDMDISLTNWGKTRTVQACMDAFETLTHVFQSGTVGKFVVDKFPSKENWMSKTQEILAERENEFSDKGTMGHGYLQKAIDGDDTSDAPPNIQTAIENVLMWMDVVGLTDPTTERGFGNASYGVGGCIDLAGNDITADFKFKMSTSGFEYHKKGNADKKHIRQVASYAKFTGQEHSRQFLLYIDWETGELAPVELTQEQKDYGVRSFLANLNAVYTAMEYDPVAMYLRGECMTIDQIGGLMGLPKPYYEDNWTTIYCGDSESILQEFPIGWVNITVTSPPYNTLPSSHKPSGLHAERQSGVNQWIARAADGYSDSMPEEEYQQWVTRILGLCVHLSEGLVWVNHKIRYRNGVAIHPVRMFPWDIYSEVIWDRRGSMALNCKRYAPSTEHILGFGKPHVWNDDLNGLMSVWAIPFDRDPNDHPCAYPAEIVRRLVTSSTTVNDTVLDPFMGSGTTLRAAKDLNRKCIGIEIEEKYCEIAATRLEQEVFDFSTKED